MRKSTFWAIAAAGVALGGLALLLASLGRSEQAPRSLKPILGDFWAIRVAYPTMHFSPAWYREAELADARIASGVPEGTHERLLAKNAASPLGLNPAAWTFIGPRPKVFGGYGQVSGRVNALLVDPRGPDAQGRHTVLAATDGGGVWKSINCCGPDTAWYVTTDQPEIKSIAIGTLTRDPNDPDVIYAGTGDLRYGSFSFGTAGLLKSTDNGETWTVLGEEVFTPFYPPSASLGFPQYQAIGKVAIDPADSARIVVGTKTGLYFSHDGGASLAGPCYTNPHLSQRQDITALLAIRVGGVTRLYAAVGTRGNPTPVQPDLGLIGANGVYRTIMPTSGCPAPGDWTLLANGWPAGTGNGSPSGKTLGRIELAVAPSDPNRLYAMAAHTTNGNVLGVWRSDDGGDNWVQVAATANVEGNGCSNSAGGGSQMWYDAHLLVDPVDPDTVYLSGVDLYRSMNGGASFQNITCGYGNGNVHVDHHTAAFLPNGAGGLDRDRLLVGTDGGVYYTQNPRFGSGGSSATNRPSFVSLNATKGAIEFYSGDISREFATSSLPGASGGAQDNGSSYARWSSGDPGPATWTVRLGGDGIYTRIEPVLEQRWYWSSQNGNLQVSTGGPTSAPQLATPQTTPAWGGDTLSFLMPYELYKHGALDQPGSGCTASAGCTYMIAGTNRVWETLSGGIPRSSWYPNSPVLTKNTLGNRSFINQLAYAVRSPRVAIAGTNDGNVWVGFDMNGGSADSAQWVNVTGANAVLPNRPVMDVVVETLDPLQPDALVSGYAAIGGFDQNTPAQPGHVFELLCQNRCASFVWRNVTGNLPNIPANAVAFNPKWPQQVFVGTDWGLYFTNDVRADPPVWQRFDNGLPRVMVWDLAIDRGLTALAAFTRGRGAYAWPLPDPPASGIFADGFEGP